MSRRTVVRRRPAHLVAVTGILLLTACGGGGFDLAALDLPAVDDLPAEVAAEVGPLHAEVERLAADDTTPPEDLGTALGRLGMLYQRYELADAALTAFAAAAELDPDQPRWPYYRGYVLGQRGDLTAAVAAFERARRLDPEADWTALRLADAELARGEHGRARELYREVLARNPGAAAAHHGLGRVALATGAVDEAIAELEATLAAAPAATAVHHPLAQAYRRAGREAEARQALARAGDGEVPRADPALAELFGQTAGGGLVEEAQLALRAGRRDDGERLLRAALEHDPDELVARFNLGVLLQRSGRAGEAEEQYREVLARDPTSTTARFNLATLLGEEGRLDEAVVELERVLAEEPDFAEARRNLATALAHLDRWPEAAGHYAALARQQPDDADLAVLHAGALLEAGRTAEAEAAFARLIAAWPERPGPRIREAEALAAAGRHRQAKARLEAGLEALPQSGELVHGLARLLATAPDPAVRDPARALELAETIYRARPDLEHGRTLAMALAAAGRPAEAAGVQRRLLDELDGAAPDPTYRRLLEEELRRYEGAAS